MDNTPPSSSGNSTPAKSGGLNLTTVAVTFLVCASVLGGIYMLGEARSKNAGAGAPRPSANVHQEESAPVIKPGIVEKGLAATGLQKAEGGQASADYYTRFLTEQIVCQLTAGSIRSIVEKVDISPGTPDVFGNREPSPNISGVRKALEVAAGYYKRSVRNKLTLSSAGIDPRVVTIVEKLAAFDQATAEAYDDFAATLQSKASAIESIGKLRDEVFEKEEAALIAGFESKFGIKLPTRSALREAALRNATAESQQFLDKKTPQELAANLLGKSFINANGFNLWEVEAGEYVFGRISDSAVGAGVVIVDLEVQLKGARSGNPGLVRARIIYVKDPVRSLYWVAVVQDLSKR